ncbi:MAG TPA: V-type ATP synthase subunit A, partial [Candidatus Omnitrophota bacterium]|nr:V-type ATP synthase subunit A [Candidatus Omnitrophota bacterium]
PGGDFSEPVTSHTKRFVRCLWALDRDLANSRHYPSISWIDSYSEYIDDIKDWWHANVDKEWQDLRLVIMELLQKEQRLQQVVKLVGPDVLPVTQRLVLDVCALFKNGFLQQVSYDAVDTYSSARKQFLMLKAIVTFYRKSEELVKKGIGIAELRQLPVYEELARMKQRYTENDLDKLERLSQKVEEALTEIEL